MFSEAEPVLSPSATARMRNPAGEIPDQLLDEEPLAEAPDPLSRAVHPLLRVRSGEEMERVAVQVIRETLGARWVGYYVADDRMHRCRALSSPDLHQASIPNGLIRAVLQGREGAIVFSDTTALRAYCPPGLLVAVSFDQNDGRRSLFLLSGPAAHPLYTEAELATLEQLVEWCAVALENAALMDELRSQVFVDPLSGCYNRRGFDEHLKVEIVRARRYQRPLTLMLLDLDRFKGINDTYGHPAGDHVLKRIGEVLLHTFRTTDRICRFGGDEFGMIFPETQKEEVVRLAKRIRGAIEGMFPDFQVPAEVTASLGIASYPEDAVEPEELLRAADRALYAAKAGGGNTLVST
jgi:diguanylate cyclase (GGDEF)-like protein